MSDAPIKDALRAAFESNTFYGTCADLDRSIEAVFAAAIAAFHRRLEDHMRTLGRPNAAAEHAYIAAAAAAAAAAAEHADIAAAVERDLPNPEEK